MPPQGIPAPGFGIIEQPGAPNVWVNNSLPQATDTNNPWGSPAVPRRTVPTVLPAGAVVDVQGGPYTILQVTWTAGGTQAQPVFLRASNVVFVGGTTSAWIRTAGSFFIIEGPVLVGVQIQVTGIANVWRTFEQSGSAGAAVAVSPGSAGTVIYRGHIHDNGDSENPVEHDVHGVLVMENTQYTWLLESHVHHNGGDAIQVGSAGSPEPWARYVWIGGNTMHEDRENAVDVKRARDVVVAQNVAYGYMPRSSSNGEIVVVHDGAQRVFVLNNYLVSGVYGVSCTQAVGIFVVGNILANIRNVGPFDPASLYRSSAVMVYGSSSVCVSQNTIVDVDSAIAIPQLTTGSGSEVVSNIIKNAPFAIRYGNATDQSLATISHNLLPPTDPLFVSASDVHLQAGSPALGQGLRSVAHDALLALYGLTITADVYGTPWPAGPPNIGAAA